MTDQNALLSACRSLVALNVEPEPGLYVWNKACAEEVDKIRAALGTGVAPQQAAVPTDITPTPEELREIGDSQSVHVGPRMRRAVHAYGQRCFDAGKAETRRHYLVILATIERLSLAGDTKRIGDLAHTALDEFQITEECGRELLLEAEERGKAAALEGPVWANHERDLFCIVRGKVYVILSNVRCTDGGYVWYVQNCVGAPAALKKEWSAEDEARAAVEEAVRNG